MGTYRLEEAPSARAGCQNQECKSNKIKIQKGELRVGTWIENERFQTFMWRHWGCVTPKLISNIAQSLEEAGMEVKEIDGFEELSEELQEKVLKATEQGHVDDADWNGDVELNRPGKSGFRVRGGAKKDAKAESAAEAEDKDKEEKPKGKQTKSKKRTAKADEEEAEEEAAPAKKPKRASRAKKAASPESGEGADEEEEKEEKPAKKSRASRSSKTERPARGKKQKAADAGAEDVNKDDGAGEDGEGSEAKPKPRRGGRKRTARSG